MSSKCTCSDPTDACGACRAYERVESALLADAADLARVLADRAPDALAAVVAGVFTVSTYRGQQDIAFAASRVELHKIVDEAIRDEVTARLDAEGVSTPAGEFMGALSSLTGYRSAA